MIYLIIKLVYNFIMINLFNKKILLVFISVLIVILPIIELDYLLYELLVYYNIPRFTTIVKFVVLPLVVLLVFYRFEFSKKKVVLFSVCYGLVFLGYFILYYNNSLYLSNIIRLPNNFRFDIVDDIVYFIGLLVPLVYIWVTYVLDIKDHWLKKLVVISSLVISVPIVVSNIFVFSLSTYGGSTIDSIFSWFSLPYNELLNHPRLYAGKFIFEEGNTIGVILTMILPLLYYYLFRAINKKDQYLFGLLVFVHSISMIILTTRIATYGTLIVPIIFLVVYLFLYIIKVESVKKWFIGFTIGVIVINGFIIPFSPAYQNQLIDATNYEFIKLDGADREEADKYRLGASELEPFSEEWVNFYVYMFEVYAYLIGVTPPVYYSEWYDYRFDPKFWVDLIFDYELYQRVNGRQLQRIFTDYKYQDLDGYNKLFGMGYSTFMRGSILLEKDFVMQKYTLGYIGFGLLLFPWLLLYMFIGVKILLGYHKGCFNLFNIIVMMAIGLGLVGAYISGHIIDELSSSLLLSLLFGVIYRRVYYEYKG